MALSLLVEVVVLLLYIYFHVHLQYLLFGSWSGLPSHLLLIEYFPIQSYMKRCQFEYVGGYVKPHHYIFIGLLISSMNFQNNFPQILITVLVLRFSKISSSPRIFGTKYIWCSCMYVWVQYSFLFGVNIYQDEEEGSFYRSFNFSPYMIAFQFIP